MVRIFTAILGILSLPWCLTEPGAHAQSLVLGYSGTGVSSDLRRVIEKEGLWRKRGLEVKPIYFTSGSLTTKAMVTGDVSVADSDLPAQLNLAVSGLIDLKVIAVLVNRLEHYFVVNKVIKRPADLKGKRVAVSSLGSSSDITTRLVLRFWKLDTDREVAILQSGNTPTRIAALVVGHVDAGLVSPTHLDKVLATGCCSVLADLTDLPLDYARWGLVVSNSILRTQREAVRKLLEGFVEGTYVYKTRPDIAMEVLKEEGISDPKVAKGVYQRLAKSFREYPAPDAKGIQAVLESLPNPKARSAKAESFVDATLFEEIKKSGYIDRLYGK